MGVVNLKWHDAAGLFGMAFSKDELAAGWPESLALHRLAILQRPARGEDRPARQMQSRLLSALAAACGTPDLRSSPATIRKLVLAYVPAYSEPSFVQRYPDGQRRMGEMTMQRRASFNDVATSAVLAQDFAAWLATQHEERSAHTAAWFEAMGIGSEQKTKPPTDDDGLMKKAALIAKHERAWPTIDADLREASRNGLKAAKMGHGMWNEAAMLQWATQRRKLKQTVLAPSAQSTFHRLK